MQALSGTEIGVFAQNCHWEREGAFTGEVSAPMLRELGVYGTIVGHSERRQWFGETDETVAKRARAALADGLDVIACVGETEAERDAGETEAVLRRQTAVLEHDDNLVVAYEPVWAIGTGRTATPEMAHEAHEVIKSVLDVPGALRRLGEARQRRRAPGAGGGGRRPRGRRLARRRLVRGDLPGRVPLVTLVILDGWGCAPAGPGNAVELAEDAGVRPAVARQSAHDASTRRARPPGFRPARWGTPRSGT